jgi:hypothetical protein
VAATAEPQQVAAATTSVMTMAVTTPSISRAPAPVNGSQAAVVEEFRDHGTSLNRTLNEALRIHSGPAWRVFRVCDCSLSLVVLPLSFLPRPCFPDLCPLVFIRRRQELEDRARERYGALDLMSFELHRL